MLTTRKLSKSRYITGQQCTKYLWLSLHRPELQAPIDEGTKRLMEMGTRVGIYAHRHFNGGVLISEDHEHLTEAIGSTEKAAASGAPSIFEATVGIGSLLCRADILARASKASHEWDIYEVKASTSVRDSYLHDVSFQRHCFEKAGYAIRRTFLTHIDKNYIRHGEIDPTALLATVDITEAVVGTMEGIEDRIENMLGAINQKRCPKVQPGPQCSTPHACPFFDLCNKRAPYDIYELPYGNKLIPKLEAMNVRYLKDIPDDLPLSERQRKTVLSARSGEAVIDAEGIKKFLDTLDYPLHFFDFETISHGIPLFDNSRPFENVPFQFSLHVQKEKDGPLVHHMFLHNQKTDPRGLLIRKMLELLGTTGSIVAYNMSFEKSVVNDMIADVPQYSNELAALLPRFRDLIAPFRSAHYVHKDFHGSASLKRVLPVLVPALSYDGLEIREGGSASLAYEKWIMGEMTEEEWQKTHQALLDYCKLDTLAMVEILRVLDSVS